MRSDKQVKINRSCIECRRRKVRCDGQQPCSNCVWYVVADNCQYQPRRRRNCSSNKAGKQIAAGTAGQSAHDTILNTLFPGSSADELSKLSRAELLQLAQEEHSQSPGTAEHQRLGEASDQTSDTDDEHEWNERQENQDPAADDVNGLSLQLNLKSYLGISSVRAALRTIFRLNPSIRDYVRQRIATWDVSSSWCFATSGVGVGLHQETQLLSPTIDEETCIDAYFLHAHEMTPMLDEADFRATWKEGTRTDGPWIALLNMVLVMGSMSTGSGDDESHKFYYSRAKQYINIELFGAGCLESLQTLCILGGYYLHYVNTPNMAHAVMGAAFRIAIGLGLHRDTATLDTKIGAAKAGSRPQLRRQLWWCLVCLDTWSHMTLGRPSQGRWDPKTMNVSLSESSDSATLSLDHSQTFCKIATRVQDRFAHLEPISISELKAFDVEVQNWHQNLPPEFRYREMCPERLLTSYSFMSNRFFNLRLLLYRPVLLSYANRKVAYDTLLPEEQAAINSCQEIACNAIDNIASGFTEPNRLRVWNSVWYLYQATMVTLVSLIADPNHPNVSRWKASTEKSLQLFQIVAPWTKPADRSRDVLASIYEASQLPRNDISDIPFDFQIAELDQFGLNAFSGGWQWDAFNGFEEDYQQQHTNTAMW